MNSDSKWKLTQLGHSSTWFPTPVDKTVPSSNNSISLERLNFLVSAFSCFAFLRYATNSEVDNTLYAIIIARSIIRITVQTSFDTGRHLTYKNRIIINTQRIVCVIKIHFMVTHLSTISYQLRWYIFTISDKIVQNVN